MNELFGNMISTSNKKFDYLERDIVADEKQYGYILFEIGKPLFYSPIYFENHASVQHIRHDFKTSRVIDATEQDGILTVKTRNSVYTFSLKH
jgi:hypothetical protein